MGLACYESLEIAMLVARVRRSDTLVASEKAVDLGCSQ